MRILSWQFNDTENMPSNIPFIIPIVCILSSMSTIIFLHKLQHQCFLIPIEQVQRPFARHRQDHCHHHVHILAVRDHVVGVLIDRVVVDIHVVVVVIVDVVVDVGHGVQGQQDKGHEVEGVEAKVANTPLQMGR